MPQFDYMVDAGDLLKRLIRRYGEIIPPDALWRVTGYQSASAARSARLRGNFPIRVFRIPGRKGFYAKTGDVANWLEKLGADNSEQDPPMSSMGKHTR